MFDHFVGIDWSGAKYPKHSHSVSLAVCDARGNAPTALTQKLSRQDVREWICKQVSDGTKTLVGIDCNLGYSKHIARQQLGPSANYWTLWSAIEDTCKTDENFFAGRWWQAEKRSGHFWQHGKQPSWFKPQELRRDTERTAIRNKQCVPESPFKLIGAKQVGKGGLAGMRLMHALKSQCGDAIAVWPFEAKLVAKATVVISENFPRLFIRKAGFGNAKIRDLDTLNKALTFFDSAPIKTTGEINDHLTDAIIASAGMRWVCENDSPLATEKLTSAAKEIEGWIFGVMPNASPVWVKRKNL